MEELAIRDLQLNNIPMIWLLLREISPMVGILSLRKSFIYERAAQYWQIDRLFLDLGLVRRRLGSKREVLEQWQQNYLCLVLTGHEPGQIANYLQLSVGSLRSRLAAARGLYRCINRLTGKDIRNWRDIILFLLNRGYRRSTIQPPEQEEIIIIVTVANIEISIMLLRELEATMQRITGSENLRIIRIDAGNIVSIVQGDLEPCRQFETSFQRGELEAWLGLSVLSVRIESQSDWLATQCGEAARNWNIGQLLLDLGAVYRKLNPGRESLQKWQQDYLCLLLAGYEPRQIAQEYLYITTGSLRVNLSAPRGLYDCIRRLTNSQIKNWRDVIILLLNQGYRKNECQSSGRAETINNTSQPSERLETVNIVTRDVEISETSLRNVETTIRQIAGSDNLRIIQIENDSIERELPPGSVWSVEHVGTLVMYCSPIPNNGENILLHLLPDEEATVLPPNLQLSVLDVDTEQEVLLDTQSRQAANSLRLEFSANPGQQFKVRVVLNNRVRFFLWPVDRVGILIMQCIPTQNSGTNVYLQLHAKEELVGLPLGVKLSVLDAADVVFWVVRSNQTDEWLQLALNVDLGEPFKVKLSLNNQVVLLEKFSKWCLL